MTTGTFYLGNCYVNASDALDHYYQAIAPVIAYNGTTTNILYFQRSSNGAWSYVIRNYTSTSSTVTSSVGAWSPIFPTCDTSNYPLSGMINLPTSTDANAAWAAGFVLPMTLAFVAWGAAKLLSTFNERK